MPKKKSTKKESPKVKPEAKRSIIGLGIIFISLLGFISIFGAGGVLGEWFARILGVGFGQGKFFVPVVFLLLGLILLFQPKERGLYALRVASLVSTTLVILLLFHLSQFQDIESAKQALGQSIGGGYVGYWLFSVGLYLLGYAGSWLAGIISLLVSGIVFFNKALHLDGVIGWILDIRNVTSEDQNSEPRTPSSAPTIKPEEVRRIFNQSYTDEEESTERPVDTKASSGQISEKPLTPVTPDWMKEDQFALPTVDLLDKSDTKDVPKSGDTKKNAEIIRTTLQTFGIEVEMGKIDIGPTVTRYMLRPSNGIKLSRITALQNDLALALAAQAIRIEAPIPGMSYVGVEIPNAKRATVRIRDIFEASDFTSNSSHLPLALGRDVMNNVIVFPLEKMPHLLIAGATGAGKSMGLNAMILSMLYKNPPSKLKFIFIDPKRVELSTYNGIPHLLTPAIVNPDKAMNALNWCVTEMERRYELLAQVGSRNIFTYNEKVAEGLLENQDEPYEIMPFIVVVIDELADLMTTHKKEVEGAIVRIAQMARAVGIHLILATQRPSTDVITGLIKANLPSRVSFQVASQIDSRTVLDMMGAEKLLGMGDMLFIGGDLAKPQRIQGAFVPESEVKAVVGFLKQQGEFEYNTFITEGDPNKTMYRSDVMGDNTDGSEDELFNAAKELVLQTGKGSASLLQRRLKVGYARAARLLDELEMAGIVGPAEGSKPREVIGEGYVEDTE